MGNKGLNANPHGHGIPHLCKRKPVDAESQVACGLTQSSTKIKVVPRPAAITKTANHEQQLHLQLAPRIGRRSRGPDMQPLMLLLFSTTITITAPHRSSRQLRELEKQPSLMRFHVVGQKTCQQLQVQRSQSRREPLHEPQQKARHLHITQSTAVLRARVHDLAENAEDGHLHARWRTWHEQHGHQRRFSRPEHELRHGGRQRSSRGPSHGSLLGA